MKKYKEIHIWDFPPTLTFIRLNAVFRKKLFREVEAKLGSKRAAIDNVPKLSSKYGITRSSSRGNYYSWVRGEARNGGKVKTVNVPLWILIEFSKILSDSASPHNFIMRKIEEKIESYACGGRSKLMGNRKFPLYLTPEMVSVIFHFVGDRHIGRKGVCSSYRQMNPEGLTNFLIKLRNVFGEFEYDKNEFKNGKLIVPKTITHFYNHYFKLPNTNTFDARIPASIMSLDKQFLIAGLVAFMVDEANIGEVIEIYSKNYKLLGDIRKIAVQCGYNCKGIRKKYGYGVLDSYRFLISSDSYKSLQEDLLKLTKEFPNCGFAHKTRKFEKLVKRKQRTLRWEKNGVTKARLLQLLKRKPQTIEELSEELNFGHSSIREHLYDLEADHRIARIGNWGRNVVWAIV